MVCSDADDWYCKYFYYSCVHLEKRVQQQQFVANLSNYANNTHHLIRREIYHFSDYYDHADNNVWWQLMHQTVRKIRNDSCYVCCLIPHAINDQPFLVPVPIATASILTTFFPDRQNKQLVEVIFPLVRNYIVRQSRNVSRFSSETNLICATTGTLFGVIGINKISRYRYRYRYLYCSGGKHTLFPRETITSVSCALTNRHKFESCPIRTAAYTISGSLVPEPFVLTLNLTALPKGSKLNGQAGKLTRVLVTFPSRGGYSCPKNMVWMYGNRSYLYLPANWSGECYLATYLLPTVITYDSITPLLER
ncbi:hypothetical protein AMECASPLE_036526 [Ameca splendens]|uniref:Uncharacterized protein n=1 Tax=Ameca splendens TaxID=208324 RepID=A0ABV0ZSW8_9TELE